MPNRRSSRPKRARLQTKMKLDFRGRLMLVLGACAVLLIGVALFVSGLQFRLVPWQNTLAMRFVLMGLGLFLSLFAGFVLWLPRRVRKRQEHFVAQQTAGGELRISLKAIESLVRRCVLSTPDISLSELNVEQSRNGVRAEIRVSMPGDVSIPLAVEGLQKSIKKQVQAVTGIDAAEVRITVETTSDEKARSSLYQLEDAALAPQEDESPGTVPGGEGYIQEGAQENEREQ